MAAGQLGAHIPHLTAAQTGDDGGGRRLLKNQRPALQHTSNRAIHPNRPQTVPPTGGSRSLWDHAHSNYHTCKLVYIREHTHVCTLHKYIQNQSYMIKHCKQSDKTNSKLHKVIAISIAMKKYAIVSRQHLQANVKGLSAPTEISKGKEKNGKCLPKRVNNSFIYLFCAKVSSCTPQSDFKFKMFLSLSSCT